MSVVCKVVVDKAEFYDVYAKGSPEIMLTIMEKGSVPNNYQEVLKEYTSNGFRVLAIASKRVEGKDVKSLSREQV